MLELLLLSSSEKDNYLACAKSFNTGDLVRPGETEAMEHSHPIAQYFSDNWAELLKQVRG